MADLKSIGLQYRSKMDIAPIIELYMSLKRQESTLCNEFILWTRTTPSPLELYTATFTVFSGDFALLRDEDNQASAQIWSAQIEEQGALLAALDEVMAGRARKIQEFRVKCKYIGGQQIVLKLSESTSRTLTRSVAGIASMKREIEVLLQQM